MLGCSECCYDCKDVACTTCIAPDAATGGERNTRGWLKELCAMLPVAYEVEWVRVYQQPGKVDVGCDPAAFPTARWIAGHEEAYRTPGMDAPLKAVTPGGAPCASDDECGGGAAFGVCGAATRTCECTSLERTGPRCLAHAAGQARSCRDLEDAAAAAARAARESDFWDAGDGAGRCAPPTSYSTTELVALAEAVCAAGGVGGVAGLGGSGGGGGGGGGGSGTPANTWSILNASGGAQEGGAAAGGGGGWSLLAAACAQINASAVGARASCSAHARATLVAQAMLVDGGGVACCDTLSVAEDGSRAPILVCRRGPRPMWGFLVPTLLGGAVLLLLLRGACSRGGRHGGVFGGARGRWASVSGSVSGAVYGLTGGALGGGVARGGEGGAASNKRGSAALDEEGEGEGSREQLAELLLWHVSDEARSERLAMLHAVGAALGMQRDNVRNQAEHLESLLLSHLSLSGGSYARAVESLHAKLLQPFERWRAHTGAVLDDHKARADVGRANAWERRDGQMAVLGRPWLATMAVLARP